MPIILGTLGPKGTNSKDATDYYLKKNNLPNDAKVLLFDTLEEGIGALVKKEIDYYIAASVYPNLNMVLFRFIYKIQICDTFMCHTNNLVLATRTDFNKKKYSRVSSVSATLSLIEHDSSIPNDIIRIFAHSNPEAAQMCSIKKSDIAVTNLPSAKLYDLKIVKDFSSINMSWTVFKRL